MKKLIYFVLTLVGISAMIITYLELNSSYIVTPFINTHAPVITHQEITVNASAQEVYEVMSDINHWAAWHPAYISGKPTLTYSYRLFINKFL